jgi:NAD(P)H-dependent FMN reductase
MVSSPLRVAVIVGSTRQGRIGDRVARWFAEVAQRRRDVELTVVDLVEFDFPASYPDEPTSAVQRFTGILADADGFVVVTPEYNRSFPASLKQAIDFAYDEWRAKAVGFVSYGCGSQGVYAIEQLRTVFTELQAVTVRNSVGFNLLDDSFDGGAPRDPERARQAVDSMLDQLDWWGRALREARAVRPYVS